MCVGTVQVSAKRQCTLTLSRRQNAIYVARPVLLRDYVSFAWRIAILCEAQWLVYTTLRVSNSSHGMLVR